MLLAISFKISLEQAFLNTVGSSLYIRTQILHYESKGWTYDGISDKYDKKSLAE